jgi:hypothetical protein
MRDTRDYDSQFYREELARDTAAMLTTVEPAEKSQLYRRIDAARQRLKDAEQREQSPY